MLNLKKAPFLSIAYEIIKAYPGCSKAEVIRKVSFGKKCPSRTYSYRNRAIDRLIYSGLVYNEKPIGRSGYALFPSKLTKNEVNNILGGNNGLNS